MVYSIHLQWFWGWLIMEFTTWMEILHFCDARICQWEALATAAGSYDTSRPGWMKCSDRAKEPSDESLLRHGRNRRIFGPWKWGYVGYDQPEKRECTYTYLWKWLVGSWFMIRRTRIFHVTWMMKPLNQHSQCAFCVGWNQQPDESMKATPSP